VKSDVSGHCPMGPEKPHLRISIAAKLERL
jgi:hypothetical protein